MLKEAGDRYTRKDHRKLHPNSRSRKDVARQKSAGGKSLFNQSGSNWNNREEIYTNVYGSNFLRPDKQFLKALSNKSGQSALM